MATSFKKETSSQVKMKQFPILPDFGETAPYEKKRSRKKVNFMVNEDLLNAMGFYISPGARSDFLNEILEKALRDVARRKASELMDEWRETMDLHLTDKEIRTLREYGRE